MKGLELSRRYFFEAGMPMLRREFGRQAEQIAAGLVGPGSDCWGYDDDISHDHDWGPGFCLWLSQELYREAGAELVRAYGELPRDFMGYPPRKPLPGEEGRVGVMATEDFYQLYTGLAHSPQNLVQWSRIPAANLALVTNGEVFHDPWGRFTAWRRVLADDYPEDLRLKQIAARCMQAGQAGQYNLQRSFLRGDRFAWQFALSQFCKEIMELAYWLNRRYPPYYKWLHRGVQELPLLGRHCHQAVAGILNSLDSGVKFDLVEGLARAMIGQIRAQGLSKGQSDFLLDHGPEVQGRIQHPEIRDEFKANV